MHQIKCTNVIKNTLCSHFEADLLNDIGKNKFSLLMDESNDISVLKLLGISIIYYSDIHKKVVSTYLGLLEIEECDAENIILAIKNLLRTKNLKLTNVTAIGIDNASVMTGINNGVYANLKTEVPSLILIRCICHSIQLATLHASAEALPKILKFIITETHKWFAYSAAGQSKYRNLYKALNDGPNPLKILRDFPTRWVAIQPAVERVLGQWLELTTLFSITRHSDKCYTFELLYKMYSDEKNLLYFLFLNPVLIEVQQVNKLLEAKSVDKVKLLNELILLIKSIGKKIVLPTSNIDILITTVDYFLNPKPGVGNLFRTADRFKSENFSRTGLKININI